jgi:ribosome-interacting GTPase 1
MLRTIPKHKGTEHLQADIKTRIKQLTEELAGPKKGGARTGPSQAVKPEGAAQICLVGPPNVGKSSLLARLTGAQTEVGPYPYTTKAPIPGMLPFEDVHLQLVDLPPISKDFMESWYVNALQPCDAVMLVVDLTDPECVDHVEVIRDRLGRKRVTLDENWPQLKSADRSPATTEKLDIGQDETPPDPFRIYLPTLLVANKSDLHPDPEEIKILGELLGVSYPSVTTSAKTGAGLERLGPMFFEGLGIVRIYTKVPGKPADTARPYTVRRGHTVLDVARLVHKDLAKSLKFARIWGSGRFQGQQVGPDHEVADRDILELRI